MLLPKAIIRRIYKSSRSKYKTSEFLCIDSDDTIEWSKYDFDSLYYFDNVNEAQIWLEKDDLNTHLLYLIEIVYINE